MQSAAQLRANATLICWCIRFWHEQYYLGTFMSTQLIHIISSANYSLCPSISFQCALSLVALYRCGPLDPPITGSTNKHEMLALCRADVGPSSTTLAQHQPNIGAMPRVCWDTPCGDIWSVRLRAFILSKVITDGLPEAQPYRVCGRLYNLYIAEILVYKPWRSRIFFSI